MKYISLTKIVAPALVLFFLLVVRSPAPLNLEGLAPPPEEKEEPEKQPEKGPPAPDKKINVPAPKVDGVEAQPQAARDGHDDVITFANEDSLHGRLMGVNPETGGLSWRHPSAEKEIAFKLDGIRRIDLSPFAKRNIPVQSAMVKLTNGDQLGGNVVSMNEETLVMDTWYAGEIPIEKVMITSLHPNAEGSAIVYEGPTDIATWNLGDDSMKNSWRLKNGALYPVQSHPIGREIEGIPDSASIEFEVDWRSYPAFNFVFYTDTIEKVSGNYYMLQISSSSVYMRRYTRNQGSQNMWNMNHSDFSNNRSTHARFNLLVDKKAKSFSLLINGTLIKQWTDPGSFAGLGNGIMFAPQNPGGMKFYNIRISEWDGTIPQPTQEQEEDSKEDQVQFVNKDKVSGTLVGIAEGKATFRTEFATMDVPLDRIGEIVFSMTEVERARRNKEDIRLTFVQNGQLTLQLRKVEKSMVYGYSENFGEVKIPLEAFRELEFNIYEERDEDDQDFDF
jgi:hypothetical protein